MIGGSLVGSSLGFDTVGGMESLQKSGNGGGRGSSLRAQAAALDHDFGVRRSDAATALHQL